MIASIISIGAELLNGRTINSNSTFIAKELSQFGIKVKRSLSITDELNDMLEAFTLCQNDSDIVICTGGLGPTNDDITRKATLVYFSDDLIQVDSELERVTDLLKARGFDLNRVNKEQALYPSKANILVNDLGTASGFALMKDKTRFYFLPGVPYEMSFLIKNRVLEDLTKHFSLGKAQDFNVYRIGRFSESKLYELIEDIINANPDLEFAFYPHFILLDLYVKGDRIKIDKVNTELIKRIEKYVYSYSEQLDLVDTIAKKLNEQKSSLACAESCTGGLLSHFITQKAGSSSFFLGSIIAYSNEIKQLELGVSHEVITNDGAVSERTVKMMAKRIREQFKSSYSIAITGIAGPGGGTDDKPVGTVWLAVSSKEKTISESLNLGTKRELIQQRAAYIALHMLWQHFLKDSI
jgi:nicotinamide-nucleotide amidase